MSPPTGWIRKASGRSGSCWSTWRRQHGLTIFLSSHLLHEVERICNRIAIIDQGRLLYQGTVQSLLEPDLQFKIRTDRTDQAFQFLSESLKLPVFKNGNDHLYLKIPKLT